LPTGGITTVGKDPWDILDHLRHMLLPAIVLSLTGIATYTRILRTETLDVLAQDFVRTAHAKGLRERTVVFTHALRNALIPVVTALGGILAALVGGALVIEQVFSWPGVGQFTFQAAIAKDYPIVQAGVMFTSTILVISYLLRDLPYEIGRSQVVRLLYGGQISLFVGFTAAFFNLTVGIALGLSAGYFRGPLDDVLTWVITTLNGIPQIYLLLIIAALWTPGPFTLVVIIGLLNWTGISLYVRGQTFALREREFVTAARTIGARDRRIMFKHILPNVLPLIFVLAAIDVGAIILLESALSFLGL